MEIILSVVGIAVFGTVGAVHLAYTFILDFFRVLNEKLKRLF